VTVPLLARSVSSLGVIIERRGSCQVDPIRLTRMARAVQPMEER